MIGSGKYDYVIQRVSNLAVIERGSTSALFTHVPPSPTVSL